MFESSIVEFVVPSDAQHIGPDHTSVACACPDCLRMRNLSMVWPLTASHVAVVENRDYRSWLDKQFEWAREWTTTWPSSFILSPWFDLLVARGFIGHVVHDPWPGTWPTAGYTAWRRKELERWLKPSSTSDRSLPAKS